MTGRPPIQLLGGQGRLLDGGDIQQRLEGRGVNLGFVHSPAELRAESTGRAGRLGATFPSASVDKNWEEVGAAELLTPEEWGGDRLAGQLGARQTWLEMRVPVLRLQRGADRVGSTERARGPARPPRGTAHAAGTPFCMPPYSRALACPRLWLLHVLCVTAGFPCLTALTRSIACPQPDSGGQLAPWALPSPDSSWIGMPA